MKYRNPLLVVKDLQRSLEFYQRVLGLCKTVDFGANVTLTGGISLQTEESWLNFIGRKPSALTYGGNVSELYFEAEDYDAFLKKLEDVELVHPPLEHRWGQRAVRLYDPDRHVIEVAEPLTAVARRFRDAGLTEEGIAKRMDVPQAIVCRLLK
jgi:catechol 2,3-dioxygenase-like lactoylglutathione lyase family enzyme